MIGIYLGAQKSGKTLSMTYWGLQYANQGYTILSNYPLACKHRIVTKDDIKSFAKDAVQFEKTVLLVDEIHILFDSRNFGKDANKYFSYYLLQSSKRDTHILGTSQVFNTIEKRFRENCDFQCYCSRVVMNEKGEMNILNDDTRILKDSKNLYIKNSYLIKRIGEMGDMYIEKREYYIKADCVFPHYDTRHLFGID